MQCSGLESNTCAMFPSVKFEGHLWCTVTGLLEQSNLISPACHPVLGRLFKSIGHGGKQESHAGQYTKEA